jgi:hypothetical protein
MEILEKNTCTWGHLLGASDKNEQKVSNVRNANFSGPFALLLTQNFLIPSLKYLSTVQWFSFTHNYASSHFPVSIILFR